MASIVDPHAASLGIGFCEDYTYVSDDLRCFYRGHVITYHGKIVVFPYSPSFPLGERVADTASHAFSRRTTAFEPLTWSRSVRIQAFEGQCYVLVAEADEDKTVTTFLIDPKTATEGVVKAYQYQPVFDSEFNSFAAIDIFSIKGRVAAAYNRHGLVVLSETKGVKKLHWANPKTRTLEELSRFSYRETSDGWKALGDWVGLECYKGTYYINREPATLI